MNNADLALSSIFVLIEHSWMFWQVVFEGVVGKSYQGDIAIDDIKLIKSPCPLPGDYFVLF